MASFGFTDPLLLAYEQAGKSLSEIRWLVLPMVDDQSESIIFNDQVVSFPPSFTYYYTHTISSTTGLGRSMRAELGS